MRVSDGFRLPLMPLRFVPLQAGASEPRDVATLTTSGAAAAPVPQSVMRFAMAATTAMAGAPAAPLNDDQCLRIMHDLEGRGIRFERNRFHVPVIMQPTKRITPEAVLDTMRRGKQDKLHVSTPGADLVPLRDRSDIGELDAFYGSGNPQSLADAPLADLLSDVEGDGYEFKDTAGATRMGRFGAYNQLLGRPSAPGGQPWACRDGVPLVAMPSDAGARPAEVRQALRQSREKYDAMRTSGDPRDLDTVRAPVGSASFADRAAVLDRFNKIHGDHTLGRVDYNLVARSLGQGERFDEVAGFLADLYSKGAGRTRDVQGAFNYTRRHLWGQPQRVQAFRQMWNASDDINSAVAAVEMLDTPLRGESYEDRQHALLQLVDDNKNLLGWGRTQLGGEQSVDDYRWLSGQLRGGESFNQIVGDYSAVLQGLRQTTRNLNDARPIFKYMREDLRNDPVRQGYFRDMTRAVGSLDQVKGGLELINAAVGSSTLDERAQVMISLMGATHRFDEARDLYQQVASTLGNDSFGRAGGIMSQLLASPGPRYASGDVLQRSYDYCRRDLGSAPTSVGNFCQVVAAERDYQRGLAVFPHLRAAVRGEDESARTQQYLRLHEAGSRSASGLDMYDAVAQHLQGNETLSDGVTQMLAVAKATQADRKAQNPVAAFRELKQRQLTNPDEVRLFMRLLGAMASYDAAEGARAALSAPVKGNGEEALFALVDQEKTLGRSPREAVQDYSTLAANLVGDESLGDGAARFSALLAACSGNGGAARARDAFSFIADNFRSGAFAAGRTPSQITAIMVESLLLNADLNAAKNHALADAKKAGNVEQGDDYVIIGGLKVPRRR